ncbi:hypothetical protein [Cryptosporangium phraense]|uniref:Uncharacterized protein n=1 Tax=Cryptosporangium phraense TaxID=2593070 RepID=A0A545ASP4_9ACTN|nr:hypothetical protein [Cryptosporangium phraense]TQS44338.1 hypothetical protein FL583_15510 [Cryptosporangium phraense]
MSIGGGITLAAGVFALIAAVLFHGFPKPQKWPKSIPWPAPWFTLVLVIGGTIGVLSGGIGAWLNRTITSVVSWASDSFVASWTGVGLAAIIGGLILVFLIKRIAKKEYDTTTLGLGAALPIFGVAIPGAIGSAVALCLSAIAGGVGSAVAAAFGVG